MISAATYDVIVMGGGPAGSAAAALIAEAGYRTLLVEREKLPRFHIGESLMPDTYYSLQRLGLLDTMRQAGFVKKYSVQFVSGSGKQSSPFFFVEHDPRDCAQTWQVERSKFDKMLFDNAAAKGAECREQTRVLEVLFDGERATGVKLRNADGEVETLSAKVIVDATGQSGIITNALGLRRLNPDMKKAAIWTYFRGAKRDPGDNGGATIVLHTKEKRAWFWYIPQSNDITSVGVVSDSDYLLKGRGTPEEVYRQELANCPRLEEWVGQGEQVEIIRTAKEFSYTTDRASGDGWVACGDAWGFIDPIYSSGVHFALKSGELTADAVIEGLQKGDTSGAQLGKWIPDFATGTQWVRRLAHAFYIRAFSFGQFLREYPQHKGNVTDILIGRVFHPEAGRIFDDLDPWLERVKREQELVMEP